MNDERNLGEKTDDSGQQPRYEHYQFHEEQGTVLKPSGPCFFLKRILISSVSRGTGWFQNSSMKNRELF